MLSARGPLTEVAEHSSMWPDEAAGHRGSLEECLENGAIKDELHV